MRTIRLLMAGLFSASALTAVTLTSSVTSAATSSSLASCKTTINSQEYTKGKLTIATDNPVYTPWFVGNKPSNGKGFESALAYAIAKTLGISKSNVVWTYEPFDNSYTPGPKKFDFDVNEISYTAQRATAVTFSESYYDVTQSIVTLKGSVVAKKHSPAALKTYLYGDQIGTTGLAYIYNKIHPTQQTRVYSTLDTAVSALESGQINAIVVDTPDGQYMATSQVEKNKKPDGVQVGQFPSTGEHYGLLFKKGNPLVGCINVAINALKSNGTLASLTTKWLNIYTSVPTIEP
ncbi:MAG: ABC transporter substrate-binding protein [Acidimicrobiales bacterium]